MERPTCSNSMAVSHAMWSAETYFSHALNLVNKYLETESPDPILLAALVNSQTKEYASAALVDAIYELAEAVQQLRREGVEVA